MTCQPGSYLWPYPTGNVKIRNTSSSFHPDNVKVDFTPVNSVELSLLLKRTTKLFQKRISSLSESNHSKKTISVKEDKLTVSVQVTKSSKEIKYKLDIDESYKILGNKKDKSVKFIIKASTFLGARHGLETLLQLIWWDEKRQTLLIMNSVDITDAPIFTYRGFMLDTAQNFLPISSILHILDGMSMNKMNVFHWHLTDSKSFPFASEVFPKFAVFGSYSAKETYSPEDVKQVVDYAETRGITVIVEVDSPAHISQGWNWGEEEGLGNLSLCLNAQTFATFCTESPCGQLNPVNNNSYSVLATLLKELYAISKSGDLIHIGGDDVDLMCWESYADVTDTDVYMNKGIMGVWAFFYDNLRDHLKRENISQKNIIVWSNSLLDDTEFWRHITPIVQSRAASTSGELEKLVKQKKRVIVSSGDVWTLGIPNPWLTAYQHQPWMDMSVSERRLVVGGEALAWTDRLDQHSLEPSIWPTAAAIAERLWSDPTSKTVPTDRLARVTLRLKREGIKSSPVYPKWCLQNPSQCI